MSDHVGSYDMPMPENQTLSHCTQVQIRYKCGHSLGGEFIKCKRHFKADDERCTGKAIVHIDGKVSMHKCRACSRSI